MPIRKYLYSGGNSSAVSIQKTNNMSTHRSEKVIASDDFHYDFLCFSEIVQSLSPRFAEHVVPFVGCRKGKCKKHYGKGTCNRSAERSPSLLWHLLSNRKTKDVQPAPEPPKVLSLLSLNIEQKRLKKTRLRLIILHNI